MPNKTVFLLKKINLGILLFRELRGTNGKVFFFVFFNFETTTQIFPLGIIVTEKGNAQ